MSEKIIRRLGVGETWLTLLHDQAYGTAQATLLASIEGKINQQLFKDALDYLVKRYPQLDSHIILQDDGYYLVAQSREAPAIKFEAYTENNAWQAAITRETNDILPQDKYLWRATLLSPTDPNSNLHHILLTIHHVVCDGASSVALIDALLEFFNDPNIQPIPDPLPDVVEKLFVPAGNDDSELGKQQDLLIDAKLYRWMHQKACNAAERKTHFVFGFMSQQDVLQLHKTCKAHQISINAAFNAAMLLAAQSMLGQTFTGGLSTPINLRSFTNGVVTNEDVGFFCGVIDTVHPDINENTDFWSLAQSYNQQLKERFAHFSLPTDYDFTELKASMQDVLNSERDYFCYNFMVTNMGQCEFPHQSPRYQLQALRFATCRKAADNNMMMLVNSTDKGLFYTFGYPTPAIGEEWAVQFVQRFEKILAGIQNCI